MDLEYPIFRADLRRYMLLDSIGGVYSGINNTALKPIQDCILQQLLSQTRAVVDIEHDNLDDSGLLMVLLSEYLSVSGPWLPVTVIR